MERRNCAQIELPIYRAGTSGDATRTRSDWRLTTAEKKRILLNNIFGVDIDQQAVEVTKLSLLLKVLEEENEENIEKQTRPLGGTGTAITTPEHQVRELADWLGYPNSRNANR